MLFEGAQGTLLDIDHGTYPFVTSSSSTAGGACTGTGVGPTKVDRVLGIAKAYITRVGSGPFPTELESCPGSIGQHLTTKGGEFGTTTGRQRRCGWYDGVIVRYAVQVNGLTDLVITKLDVLSELETIQVCVAYEYEGHRYNDLPCHQTVFHHAKPIYEELAWLEERYHRVQATSTSCPRRRATTSASSRISPRSPSRSSPSAPSASRRSCAGGRAGSRLPKGCAGGGGIRRSAVLAGGPRRSVAPLARPRTYPCCGTRGGPPAARAAVRCLTRWRRFR